MSFNNVLVLSKTVWNYRVEFQEGHCYSGHGLTDGTNEVRMVDINPPTHGHSNIITPTFVYVRVTHGRTYTKGTFEIKMVDL